MRSFACLCLLAATSFAQQGPDVAAQREAMKKLSFLAGNWSGDGTSMGQGGTVKFRQSEAVQFKLDGLVLLIEGTGRDPDTNAVKFSALATVSYDDAAKVYRFRSYSAGGYLDTDLKVLDQGFEWGYKAGPANVRFTMKVNPKGEWVETGELTMPGSPARPILDMTLTKK